MEDAAGDVDEWYEQEQFKRIDDVVGQLRRDEIEPQYECGCETEDGGAAENGVDADEQAEGDAPGKFSGRRTHAQQGEDREDNASVSPVVVDGRGRIEGGWAARTHC